jgi:hypothetical protein
MAVWGNESMVYKRRSPGGPCSDTLWTVVVLWSRRSLMRRPAALFWHSACQLCRLGPASPRWTFWSLLGGEGGRLQGLTPGPRSPRAHGSRGEALSSCVTPHAWPCRESGRQYRAQRAASGSPRASVARGMSSCARALAGVVGQAGAKGRGGVSS